MARKKKPSATSSSKSSPYAAAANLLTQVLEEKKSFKKLVYSKEGSLKCTKTTYAQVSQVLCYKPILDQILEKVPKLHEDVHNSGLLYVLVYELLLGPNQAIKGGGVVKRKLLQHEKNLRSALTSNSKLSKQLEDLEAQKIQHNFPRYARVNTLLTTTEEICQSLRLSANDTGDESGLEFYVDAHVPDLLVFSPSLITGVMNDDEKNDTTTVLSRQQVIIRALVESGKLILQDKSSCLPALCLVHGYDSSKTGNINEKRNYVDACAAPGNKTQHLAALVGTSLPQTSNKNKKKQKPTTTQITALDMSPDRLASLSKRMQQLVPDKNDKGVKVVTQEQDFLETKHDDFETVGSILLDPSCSGSGIYTAPDRWTERKSTGSTTKLDADGTKRVESLSNFQEKALRHAMSFPSVSRIVYSTCSLHNRENEVVVSKALAGANADESDGALQWRIVAPQCLQQWKRRGHVVDGLSDTDAECMIRATAEDDTNGFFVCCLERKTQGHDDKKTQANEKIATGSLVDAPKGVEVYKRQFSKHQDKPSTSSKLASATSSDQVRKETPKDVKQKQSAGTKKTNDKMEKKTKVKTAVKSNAATSDKTLCKKQAKKLAWKKRQLEQKQERLKKKPKTASTDEDVTS